MCIGAYECVVCGCGLTCVCVTGYMSVRTSYYAWTSEKDMGYNAGGVIVGSWRSR